MTFNIVARPLEHMPGVKLIDTRGSLAKRKGWLTAVARRNIMDLRDGQTGGAHVVTLGEGNWTVFARSAQTPTADLGGQGL
ncbi:hypothetical protein A5636_08245 [Mycobacterium asiaticum]|uniref:Uncharacterized protein n=1 Tax=Mycobacterium asiaticum TaxID=1790 RepID=A0A1A3MZ42_MYCAS|nr:hypothetical protein A5636_08245 [Mycobacterium asiaticum]